MEREIIFRGKRIDNGEWVEGVPLVTSISGVYMVSSKGQAKNSRNSMVIKDVVVQHEVDHETVGQYTGLNDKNGKRIFEGDIVNNTDIYGHSFDFIVEWDEKYSFFFARYNGESFGECLIDLSHPEIIGSIHDNPELLEVQG